MTPEEHYRKAEELAEYAEDAVKHAWGSPTVAQAAAQAGFLHLRLAEIGAQTHVTTTTGEQ